MNLTRTMPGAADNLPLRQPGWRQRARRLAGLGLIALAGFWHGPGFAVDLPFATANPNKVEAAYLRNFARYVAWPTNAFADTRSPWRIGVLGDDPFGDVLGKTFAGRTEQGRTFEIVRTDTLEKLPSCQIVFISLKDATKRRAALAALKHQAVLTVSDAPDFLREGGIIQFQVGNHVEMSVNLDQARAVSLKIQSEMLEVSRAVLENGTVRELR